jgi:hypothetical protein
MGKVAKTCKEFIANIPDEKLLYFPSPGNTMHGDVNFRLDLQNVTHDTPPLYNIQVQINTGCTLTTAKRLKQKDGNRGTTFSKVLVPMDGSWDAATIREALLAGMKQFAGGK